MSDITCPNCGAALPAAAMFCTSCGTRIAPVAEPAEPEPAAPVPGDFADDPTQVGLGTAQDPTQVFATPPVDAPSPAPPPPAPWQPSPPAWQPPAPGPPFAAPPPAAPSPAWGTPADGPPSWAAPAAAPPPKAAASGSSPLGGMAALIGGVLTLVGLFTAWIGNNQGGPDLSGWDLVSGDEFLTSNDPYLVLGLGLGALVLGVLLFTGVARPVVRLAAIVAGVAVIAIAARDWASIVDLAKDLPSTVELTAEFGFYLTIAGGVLTILAALVPRRRPST